MGTDIHGFLLNRRRINPGLNIILGLWIKISDLSGPRSSDVNTFMYGIDEPLHMGSSQNAVLLSLGL